MKGKLFVNSHKKLLCINKFIAMLAVIFFFIFINNIFINLTEKIDELNKLELGYIEIFITLVKSISSKVLVTIVLGLIGLYVAIANFLRKQGSHVSAIMGIELDEKVVVIVNKKDKPLIFNDMHLCVNGKEYLRLEDKDGKVLKMSSDFEIVKPYEFLKKTIKNSKLIDDIYFDSDKKKTIVLSTDEGLVVCEWFDIAPIEIKSFKYPKKIKIINGYRPNL